MAEQTVEAQPQEAQDGQGFRAYASIIRTKEAYAFDFATLLMRLYMPMITLGVVSMITLAGHSALFAGTVSSTVAAALFLISPRVSKRIDERGQSAVVPGAAALAMGGLFAMLAIIHFGLPNVLCYPCAVLMGFSPSPQALARTRWLFLIETGRLGQNPPAVRTVFSYEGVVDDVAFMIGPALCIGLGAAIVPVAGMLFGGCCYVAGTVMLMGSRSTEPDERWRLANVGQERAKGERTVLGLYPSVRVLFVLMLLMGATFGIFDTTTVALTEELGVPLAASVCLVAAAVVSISAGFVFGGMRFKATPAKLLLVTAILFAVGYGIMFFIDGVFGLFMVSVLGAFTYAPFFISTNNVCERCVPKSRITEALTWIGAGFSCGSAIGPTMAGFFVDFFGASAGFDAGAVFSFAIIPVALLGYRLIRKADFTSQDS
ncbi:MAG: MFS transporter [Eggerthellaceae bacterium]|nr:MFS transporter [Eggerthellaceae bacterium]